MNHLPESLARRVGALKLAPGETLVLSLPDRYDRDMTRQIVDQLRETIGRHLPDNTIWVGNGIDVAAFRTPETLADLEGRQ